jgi:hypothetical protein
MNCIHLDFHTSPAIGGIGERFNKEEFTKVLKAAKVDLVTVFAKCHHGYSYYPTKVGTMHPGLKFNLLKEEIEAIHAAGAKAPIYITIGWSEKDAIEHPEWQQLDFKTGKPFITAARKEDKDAPLPHCSWTTLCTAGGYLDYLEEITREVCESFDVSDGIFYDICFFGKSCGCESCRAGMRALGMDAESLEDAEKYYVIKRREMMARLNGVIRSYNKDCDFSILGTMMKDAAKRTRGGINVGFNSLFIDAEYREMYSTLKNYQYEGYYGTPAEGQRAAVSFMEGDARIKQEYEEKGVYVDENGKEYYVVVAQYPEATESELYGNMFAVYANSNHLARSMEVITYLNTNAALRNLLQYGILGQHYELNADGTAHLLTSSESEYGTYRMTIEKTGNCFIATPHEDAGADAWTYAKQQNNDSLINPLLGFDFNMATADSDYSLDVALIDHINELSAQAKELVDECTTKAELNDLMMNDEDGFKKIYSSSAGDVKLNKATNNSYDPESPLGPEGGDNQTPDKSGSSPYTVYQAWLTQYGYAASATKK